MQKYFNNVRTENVYNSHYNGIKSKAKNDDGAKRDSYLSLFISGKARKRQYEGKERKIPRGNALITEIDRKIKCSESAGRESEPPCAPK